MRVLRIAAVAPRARRRAAGASAPAAATTGVPDADLVPPSRPRGEVPAARQAGPARARVARVSPAPPPLGGSRASARARRPGRPASAGRRRRFRISRRPCARPTAGPRRPPPWARAPARPAPRRSPVGSRGRTRWRRRAAATGGGAPRAVCGGVASRASREHGALEVERGDGLELVRQLRAHAVPLALRAEENAAVFFVSRDFGTRFEEAHFSSRGGGADFENARRARVREDVPCGTGRSRLRPGPRRRRVCGSGARGRVGEGQDARGASGGARI